MKRIVFSILFICASLFSHSQSALSKANAFMSPSRDSLIARVKKSLAISKEDTNKVNLLLQLTGFYMWPFPDSALPYSINSLALSKKLHFRQGELQSLHYMGETLAMKGNYARALEIQLEALHASEKNKDPALISEALVWLGNVYYYSGDYDKALFNYNRVKSNKSFFNENQKIIIGFIGESYFHLNQLDSAFFYMQKAYELNLVDGIHWIIPYLYLGKIYLLRNEPEKALWYYRQAIKVYPVQSLIAEIGLASVFKKAGNVDSAIYYSKLAITLGQQSSLPVRVIEAGNLLTEIYKSQHNSDSALKYLAITAEAKDSLFSQEKVKELQNISFNEQTRQQEAEAEQVRTRNRERTLVLIVVAGFFLLIAIILYRNNRRKQKVNSLLELQKEEIQRTLGELRSTQSQLIQSEKMASLGELTAGIAHEIQNPLNFVNNFSEVNKELINDLVEEVDKGNIEEVKAIASDIKDNSEKINHHGKRADAIVKGMLQHSRTSSGVKELTNINALCDEYLRLAYHGMRAKDKNFNAEIKTDFDESVGKINVVPQDIGRVLLNLFNNAFYALNEKITTNHSPLTDNYKPLISVQTKQLDDKIEISVKDNGNGIPQDIVDKIFQPFFTTKPTGEGTGLGLSLSYDIIKAHGGEIKVETKEGEGLPGEASAKAGSVFIIQLPVSQ